MLKLNASYSKKVPAHEKYSSQSFLASIEVELPHGLTTRELQSKIHDTFELVKQSVENELTGQTAQRPSGRQQRPERPSEAPEQATNKQIQFIMRLAKERNQGLAEVNRIASDKFGAESIYQLTKRDASRLVDELKIAA